MDPQMVWDMMDECEGDEDTRIVMCQSLEPAVESSAFEEKPAKPSSTGWMGFPVYGLNR